MKEKTLDKLNTPFLWRTSSSETWGKKSVLQSLIHGGQFSNFCSKKLRALSLHKAWPKPVWSAYVNANFQTQNFML